MCCQLKFTKTKNNPEKNQKKNLSQFSNQKHAFISENDDIFTIYIY